jgi:hypothetical protein
VFLLWAFLFFVLVSTCFYLSRACSATAFFAVSVRLKKHGFAKQNYRWDGSGFGQPGARTNRGIAVAAAQPELSRIAALIKTANVITCSPYFVSKASSVRELILMCPAHGSSAVY